MGELLSRQNVDRRTKPKRRLEAVGRWKKLSEKLLQRTRGSKPLADPISRWGKLAAGLRLAGYRRSMVAQRWRKLVKVGAARGFYQINTTATLKRMNKTLGSKNNKLRQLEIFGRWRVLYNGLLQPGQPKKKGGGALPIDRWTTLALRITEVMKASELQ